MLASLKRSLRSWARRNLLSPNTIRYRVEYARVREAVQIAGKRTVAVDGGAGGGQMLRLLYEEGFCDRGIAVEYDPELCEVIRQNYSDAPALSLVPGSLLDIPLADATADCVMTTQVLEHIEDHEKAAEELGRILKPGGYLIVSVPHPPEPYHTPGHVREGYTEADLEKLFPPPVYKRLYTGYSMTRPTMNRIMFSMKLPFQGGFLPVSWADKETMLTNDQRKSALPYGITCLFKKAE